MFQLHDNGKSSFPRRVSSRQFINYEFCHFVLPCFSCPFLIK